MGRRAKVDKRLLLDTIERAYGEGIGACRLAWLTGYSSSYLRKSARDMGIAPLEGKRAPSPSAELLRVIAEVRALVDAVEWR